MWTSLGREVNDHVSVKWHLIPDGSTSIVRLTIEGHFTVSSDNATSEAEAGIAALVARISTEDEATIHEKLVADVWLGDHERPDEPSASSGEQGSRACMPRPAEQSAPVRSLPSGPSRRDPMPALFVVGLAILTLSAIFGAISIGRFLVEISGGK